LVNTAPNVPSDSHMGLSTANQPLTVSCAERSTAPKYKNPLEQRSLTRPIPAVHERQAWW